MTEETTEVVDNVEGMNIIDSIWAFKLKRYPDGASTKFKAWFCTRGDRQLEGIDFFETYALVVQWTTVRLLLILEVLLQLKSKQGNITAAFLHSELDENEKVYVEMPLGLGRGQGPLSQLHLSWSTSVHESLLAVSDQSHGWGWYVCLKMQSLFV